MIEGGGLCAGGRYLGCRCLGRGPTDPILGQEILTRSPAVMKKLKSEWEAEQAKQREAAAQIESDVLHELLRRQEVEQKWPEYVSTWYKRHYPDIAWGAWEWLKVPKRFNKRDETESEETRKRILGPNPVSVEDADRHRYGTKDTPDYIKERLRKEGEEAMKNPHKPARPAFFENEPLYGDT